MRAFLVGPQGLEPQPTAPKTAVLPLDDGPAHKCVNEFKGQTHLCQAVFTQSQRHKQKTRACFKVNALKA